MNVVHTSVKRPIGVIMIVLTVLVLGAVSLKNLAVDLFPDINVPVAVVATSYPGAAPQEVEQLVTRTIESAVSSIDGISAVESVSQPGSSLVILQFDWGRDIDSSMNDIRDRVDSAVGALPDGANRPSIMRFDPQQLPIMWIGLSGAEADVLEQIAERDLSPAFERIDGVASVGIEGGKTREIQVQLDTAKLATYGLSADQIIQAIGSENRSASAGNLERGTQDLQLRINGEFTSISDIEETPIMSPTGATIKVSDVANVTDTFKEMETLSRINGEDAVVLSIQKQSNSNTVQVSDKMIAAVEDVKTQLGEDLSLDIIIDTSEFVRQSISSVTNNMIVGGVLSIAILLLFLRSVRATLVIGIAIPIAVIATFTLMYFTGETLNVLSMGGLALGLGMMVDNSIVILENIFNKRQQGYSMIEAAKEGGSELTAAVIAATLTTVVVFLPIVFVEGIASEIFRPLALTVGFSLFASLAVSLTIVPMLSSKLLKKVKIDQLEEQKGFTKLLGKVTDRYESVLNWAVNRRKTTMLITGLLIVLSLALVPFIGTSFIPEADQGQVQVDVTLQTGSKLNETSQVTALVEEKLAQFEDIIQTSYVSIGSGSGGMSTSSNLASFTIQLIRASDRELTTSEFSAALEKEIGEIPGAEITVVGVEAGLGGGSPVQVNISGSEFDVLEDLAQQVMWLVEDVDGTTNIDSSIEEGRPELQVVVDRDMAAYYGLSQAQIMNEISIGFTGQIATRYREAGNEFDVRVILPEANRQTIGDVETMTIRNPQGTEIPLVAVAELTQIQGPAGINRSNQQRQVRVTSDLDGVDLGTVSASIEQGISRLNIPDGYNVTLGGQAQDMAESFGQLTLALLLAIFLVYMVMAVQFESFFHPFVIMFSLPTTVVGVLVGLFVTNQTLSIPAFIGLIMLSGIVVNNAIILVSYINILREKGQDRHQAILEAGRSRLRPILMTTLTTVLAMVPLALGIGEGAETQMPMAIVVIFGLLFSTVFTLVLVPVMYVILDNVTKRIGSFSWKRKKVVDIDE